MDEIAAALAALDTAVAAVVMRGIHTLSDAQVGELIDAGSLIRNKGDAIIAVGSHENHSRSRDVRAGATSESTYLRNRTRVSVHTGRRLASFGDQIANRPAVAAAAATGALTVEQAEVIGKAIGALPSGLAPALVDKCEKVLLGHATKWEPATLAKLGARILDHVAPEIADDAQRARLDREEARAAKTRSLTITDQGDGRSRLSAWFGSEDIATIRATLEPLSKPTPGPNGGRDPRSASMRLADALTEACRLVLATDRLPDNGGARPQLNVTVNFDAVTKQLGVGTLDTGEQLSPSAVRRLACDALIIPAVLNSTSEILDLGRARRLISGTVRRALELRDGGCAFPGCHRPAKWCDGHHIRSWVDGGVTSVDNGVLLCGHHHRFIHHNGWQVRLAADRRPEFIPPKDVDPDQVPQRNIFHRRP